MKTLSLFIIAGFTFQGLYAQQQPVDPEAGIRTEIAALEDQYSNFYKWLAPLYDKEIGGFRMAHSSTLDKAKYNAGIESTSQAIHILATSGLMPSMPAEMKNKLIHYYEDRKDTASGFFYDTDDCTNSNTRLLGRASGYSKGALQTLKGTQRSGQQSKTKNPASEKRIKSILEKYPELATVDSFTDWLNKQNWDNPWVGGDRAQARLNIMQEFPEKKLTPLKKALFAFLEKKQSPETGLWGNQTSNTDYTYISGAFKVALIYEGFQLKIPQLPKIYQSVLKCLRNEKADRYTFVRNPLSLLEMMIRNGQDFSIPANDVAEIIKLTRINNARFLKKDGGFGRLWGAGYVGDTPCIWSAGLDEGDLNSGTQAINQVRRICYILAGINQVQPEDAKHFYEYLKKYQEGLASKPARAGRF